MIAGEQLAAWLGDKARQTSSYAAVQAFVGNWSAAPLMAELTRELGAMGSPTPPQVLAAARHFFDRVGDIQQFVAALIESSRRDPFFVPPVHPLTSDIHAGILLFHHHELSIGLGVTGVDQLAAKKAVRTGPASVGFTGAWNLFRYLKAGNAVLSWWEAPPIEAGFRSIDAGQCRRTGTRRLADGDEILLDGSRESFIIDHADGDILYLHALVRSGAAPLTAEYDSDTRRFIGATSTDEASSRVQMMVTLLREMDREDAVPVLRDFLANPHFYTRWHVMRELLALDAEAVLPDLRRMATDDPHPEVRAAASQTLTLFFAEASEPVVEDLEACHA